MRIFLLGVVFLIVYLFADYIKVRRSGTELRILMTANGFSPRKIDVAAGTQLIFMNKDTTNHWPVSEAHPNHAISPQFDAKRAVKPGQAFRYRPLQPDFIKFHDHLFPFSKGTLVVRSHKDTAAFSMIDRIGLVVADVVAAVKNSQIRVPTPHGFLKLTEVEKYNILKALVKREGAQRAWGFVDTAYAGKNTENSFDFALHNLGHFVGWKLYEEKGIDGLQACTATLSYGCYHGVADRVLTDNPGAIAEMEQACYLAGSGNLGTFPNCIHGVGHAITMSAEPGDFAVALQACDTMKYSPSSCYKGAFMELGLGAPSGSMHQGIEKKSELFSLCLPFEEKYQSSCAGQVMSIMEKMYKLSSTDVIPICLEADDDAMRTACVTYIAQKAAVRANGNTQSIRERCNHIPAGAWRSLCISVALKHLDK